MFKKLLFIGILVISSRSFAETMTVRDISYLFYRLPVGEYSGSENNITGEKPYCQACTVSVTSDGENGPGFYVNISPYSGDPAVKAEFSLTPGANGQIGTFASSTTPDKYQLIYFIPSQAKSTMTVTIINQTKTGRASSVFCEIALP